MSKVYVVQLALKIDGQDKTLNVFARADSAAKALKSVATVRRAKIDDFLPEVPPQGETIPSSTPEPSNE